MIEAAVVTFLIWLAGVFSGLLLMRLWMRRRRHTLADLGPMLLAQRTKRGLTQSQAALQCRVSCWRYGKYERRDGIRDLRDLCARVSQGRPFPDEQRTSAGARPPSRMLPALRPRDEQPHELPCQGDEGMCVGRVIWNVVPMPGSLVATTSPP